MVISGLMKNRALAFRRAAVDGTVSITALARKGPPRGDARGDGFGGKDVRGISSGVGPRMAVAVSCGVGLLREGRGKHREVLRFRSGSEEKGLRQVARGWSGRL